MGLLSGTRGSLWQFTAIDVASSFVWAELHATPRSPSSRWASRLARRAARDLSARVRQLEKVMTDNGSKFRSNQFGRMVTALGAREEVHPCRPAADQRLRGESPGHHP